MKVKPILKPLLITTLAVSAFVLIGQNAHGKERRHHRIDANGNPVGRFTCGLTQRNYFGIADKKYNLALAWASFPHTSAQPGAVVVQRRRGHALGGGQGGHVSRIVEVLSACEAIVSDSRGTYKRNICKNLVAYVRPGGIGFSARNADSHARQETVTQ